MSSPLFYQPHNTLRSLLYFLPLAQLCLCNFLFPSSPPLPSLFLRAILRWQKKKRYIRAGKTAPSASPSLSCHDVYSSFIASFIISQSWQRKMQCAPSGLQISGETFGARSLARFPKHMNHRLLFILQLESAGCKDRSFWNIMQMGPIKPMDFKSQRAFL